MAKIIVYEFEDTTIKKSKVSTLSEGECEWYKKNHQDDVFKREFSESEFSLYINRGNIVSRRAYRVFVH